MRYSQKNSAHKRQHPSPPFALQAQAEGLRERLHAQIQVLHQSMGELGKVSKAVSSIQAGKLSELAEKDQRRMRSEMKADRYVAELASLQAKLKKVGLAEEVRPNCLLSCARNCF